MKKSIILIVTLIVLAVLLIMGGGHFTYIVHEKLASERSLASAKAFYIAEAGLDKALSNLKSGSSSDITETFGDGEYTVNITNLAGLVYRLEATGTTKNSQGNVLATRNITMYVEDTPFNLYSYFTNSEYYTQTICWGWWCWSWQTPVWFITGDRLEGPIFSNSDFHISGSPAFYGQVRSAADDITYMHGGPPSDNPYFDPSYSPNPKLGEPAIDLPSFNDANIQNLKSNGERYEGDTTIVFRDDGTMDVTNSAKGWSNHNVAVPDGGGIFVNGGNLYIEGTLKGEVTLGTGKNSSGQKGNVVVTDNVRFSDRYDDGGALRDSPLLAEGSGDYLGLLAESDVIISKDAPHNVEVDASIMALGDSFIVERWYDRNYNKGTLTVLGGIIQEERGPVGTFSGSSKRSGYSKNYIYDQRLDSKYLPYFPTTGEYGVKSWRQ